jgi:nicotinate phosphoribosyltransferase
VDTFGIGTHLVTCYSQPALGCVYKLVEINGHPRIKLSEDLNKVTIPCKKQCFRLYGREGVPLVDLLIGENEATPQPGERILCRHPFVESKRAYVVPTRVEPLYKRYWSSKPGGREKLPSLEDVKKHCMQQLAAMRSDHMRALNPTPFKVCHMCHYNFILFSLFMMLTDPCYWYCFRVCFCRFLVTVQWPVIVNPRLMPSLVFSP